MNCGAWGQLYWGPTGEGIAHLVYNEHLVVDLNAEVVGLDDELVLGAVSVARKVGIGVEAVVLDFLQPGARTLAPIPSPPAEQV